MYTLRQLQAKVGFLVSASGKYRRSTFTLVCFLIFYFCLLGPSQLVGPQVDADRAQAPRGTVPVQEMLRFHVRAHSNNPRDQKIKNLVAEKVLAHYQPEWSHCNSSAELSLLLKESNTALEKVAREILQEYGCAYDVHASLVRDIFPARCYEGELYPPGEYLALYLILGEGSGENWWCVLFPPLCFSAFPSLTAVDEEGQGVKAPGNGSAEDNKGSQVSASLDGNSKDRQGRDKIEKPAGTTRRQPQKWRFWLWEKLTKGRR